MTLKRQIREICRTLAVLGLVSLALPAQAMTAAELFEDGNRLFRDDLYWAALLRYREAADAGMNTPLLHYNTGVAHYKARQHARARRSLLKSSTYAPLAAISHYNLGLNAYAAGDLDEALRWFRSARDQSTRRDLSRLARRAIRQVEDERELDAPITVQQVVRERERKFTNLSVRVRSGAGMDNNVYRSPAESYVDLADPTQPTVTPEVQSGVYIPFSLRAKYQVNAMENEGFFGSYRFGGRFYQDEALANADEYLHEIAFGSEYGKRTEERETRVYSAFKIAQHDETYYDPDDGVNRDIGGVDISNRLSYLRYGPEFWARKRWGFLSFGFRAKGQLWNYEDPIAVPEYDHEYWLVGLNSHIRVSETSLLRLSAEYYTRRYGDRPAYELDGTQLLGNENIRYDYIEYSIEARQRITNAMWFAIGYARTERGDKYLGYNNYLRDDYNAAMNFRFGRRFRLSAGAHYYIYDYENAFAFHEPTAGRKTQETLTGRVSAAFRMTDSLDLVAEYDLRDVTSNDSRIEYNRGQAILAIRWSQR